MTIVYSEAVKRAAIFMALCGLCAGLAGHCSAAIVEFPILSSSAAPEGITCGPDGAYWFAEFAQNQIGRIDTNGVVTEYPTPTTITHPFGIVTGPDGNLWFTESFLSQVARISTNGVIQEYTLPFGFVGTGITVGADNRLWLADFGYEYVPGAPTNGGIIAFSIGTNGITNASYYNANLTLHSRPMGITSGPDGNIYFTEQLAGKIGRITTNGVITEATVTPTNGQPFQITTGPDGALWFTMANTNALGRIATSNFTNVMLLSLPANNAGGSVLDEPNGIVTGKDGNLYYTDSPAGILGQVGLNGTNPPTVVQFYTPTTNANPWLVATGPDSNIWFGELTANNIGKFLMPVPLSIQFVSNQVFISWTTNVGTNFVLEDNTGFNPTNWMVLTNIPVVNTNTHQFTVDFVPTNNPPTNTLFFRLID